MNLKTEVTRKQSKSNFPKKIKFITPDTHTYILVTTVLRCALLPYYRRNSFKTIVHKRRTVFSSQNLKNLIYFPFSGVFSMTKNSWKWNGLILSQKQYLDRINSFSLTHLFPMHPYKGVEKKSASGTNGLNWFSSCDSIFKWN